MTSKAPLAIGDKMADGTIYAGLSPDTGERMYAAPADAAKCMVFNDAANAGKKDFRLPSKGELEVLYKNRDEGALQGTFNSKSSSYLSSTEYDDGLVWYQRFSDGHQNAADVGDDRMAVRYIRCGN